MLSDRMQEMLNQQINHELSAGYQYLAMAAWFEDKNFGGFAHWMMAQSQEEQEHAMRLYHYVLDRGGKVQLAAIEKPANSFSSPSDVFSKSYELEQANTRAIHALYGHAVEEKDYATQSQLQWFIDEQVEEEKTTSEIRALLEMAGENLSALLILNRQLGERGRQH